MKKHKLFSAIISIAFCAAVFSSCSSNSSGGNSTVNNSSDITISEASTSSSAQNNVSVSNSGGFGLKLGSLSGTLNGSAVNDLAAFYSTDTFGENFCFTCSVDSLVLIFFGIVPTDQCKADTSYTKDMFTENLSAGLYIYDYSDSYNVGYYYLNAFENSDMISDASINIGNFSSGKSAEFELNLSFTYNGKSYDFDGIAYSSYISAEEISSSSSDNSSSSGQTCTYCGGSGICSVCYGLGYTTWGGTTIDCASCDNGICYYCEGTGIQVYLTRGVRIS